MTADDATGPVLNPPVVGTQVFAANLERLKIDGDRIMSVHGLKPDRLTGTYFLAAASASAFDL